jgi:hypothetical protein
MLRNTIQRRITIRAFYDCVRFTSSDLQMLSEQKEAGIRLKQLGQIVRKNIKLN